MSLLEIQDLQCSFTLRGSTSRAVAGVSLSIEKNETVGLVGESGSGKTVLSLSMLQLIPQPPAKVTGAAHFNGVDLISCSQSQIRAIRGNRLAMVFQDPSSSLNPYMRISEQLIEHQRVHKKISRNEALNRAVQALTQVGIQEAANRIYHYPHEFSGGMRQRVMIAMALVNNPELVIADEPTTALDVTVQAQILELLKRLKTENGMAVLFITHNLGIVAQFCERVLVMYAGRIVESALTRDLYLKTAHPYTRALIRSVPSLTSSLDEKLFMIPGNPPNNAVQQDGCPFAPRCEFAADICKKNMELQEVAHRHLSSCIRIQQREIVL